MTNPESVAIMDTIATELPVRLALSLKMIDALILLPILLSWPGTFAPIPFPTATPFGASRPCSLRRSSPCSSMLRSGLLLGVRRSWRQRCPPPAELVHQGRQTSEAKRFVAPANQSRPASRRSADRAEYVTVTK